MFSEVWFGLFARLLSVRPQTVLLKDKHVENTFVLLASHINRLECYFNLNSELNFDLFVIISQVSIVSKPIGDVILIVVISDDYLVITSSTNKHKTFQCNFHSFHFHRLPRRLSFKNITIICACSSRKDFREHLLAYLYKHKILSSFITRFICQDNS